MKWCKSCSVASGAIYKQMQKKRLKIEETTLLLIYLNALVFPIKISIILFFHYMVIVDASTISTSKVTVEIDF